MYVAVRVCVVQTGLKVIQPKSLTETVLCLEAHSVAKRDSVKLTWICQRESSIF
jgi:hypothetical protein